MKIKYLVDEDIANYKLTSMFIGFPHCTFKCDKECGKPVCQNSKLATDPEIEIDMQTIVDRYINNPLTHAIVIGGLEPFDDFDTLAKLVLQLRAVTNDDIVIYTGYNENEILEQVQQLITYQNIVIKYGRFIPDVPSRFDPILGITLASENQYSIQYIGLIKKDSRDENYSK